VIPLRLDELPQLGELDARADEITGVKIDSRKVEPGDLFVALGRGVDFLSEALAQGASATLVPEKPFEAMAALGTAVRERSNARVVGITGSTGKTSTKDILAALCAPSARTVAAESASSSWRCAASARSRTCAGSRGRRSGSSRTSVPRTSSSSARSRACCGRRASLSLRSRPAAPRSCRRSSRSSAKTSKS